MNKLHTYLFFFLTWTLYSQNSVGLLHQNLQEQTEGYNLIYPNNQADVFLLDNCGRIVHQWSDNKKSLPGTMAHLLQDGSILRASTNPDIVNSSFGSGGSGGIIDLVSWDNDLLWRYIIADSIFRQHHEVLAMPNGNVLALVYQRQDYNAIKLAGFDTISNIQEELWSDLIVEIDPESDSIVWQWNAWDHLVQEFDSTKNNYGLIAQEDGSIHLNYQTFTNGRPDFIHLNSVDYNEELDQILVSARNFSEIWIIDHSTSIEEAASNSGGNYGRGGQLLFRWGNPETYTKHGEDKRKLFNQHDAKWINQSNLEDLNGSISVYNNNVIPGMTSLGHIIKPIWDSSNQIYQRNDEELFLPEDYSHEFSHPETSEGFSGVGSSLQVLKNGNAIMHAATQGRSFELDQSGNLLWEYKLPFRFGARIEQGTELMPGQNFVFQLKRYSTDFQGFTGRDLSPGEYLELKPDLKYCDILDATQNFIDKALINIFPNPSYSGRMNIQHKDSDELKFSIVSLLGRIIRQIKGFLSCIPFFIRICRV